MPEIEEFASREVMTRAARGAVLDALRAGLDERGRASLAASGGSTPVPLYEALAGETSLAWERVTVTLADERMVPPDHEHRNGKMVRRTLLSGPAKAATYVPLDEPGALDAALFPLDVAVMGMGEDGHTASWFPQSPGLAEALEGAPEAVVHTVPDPMPEGAPHERLTLTRAAITGARLPLLMVTGEAKRAVLEEAMRHGQVETLPVRALLHAPDTNLRVLYAD